MAHSAENHAHYREPVGPDWLARQRSGVPREVGQASAERHGTGLAVVGCPAHGPCYWVAGVSFWALGPALAAANVAQLSAEHTYTCPVWIRECQEGKPWTS